MNRLQKLQNKCLRKILNVDKFTSKMRSNLNCLSVNQIIVFRTLLFIQKMINHGMPDYLHEKVRFNRESQKRILRIANDIELIAANMTFIQNFLFSKGAQLYDYMILLQIN